MVGWMDLTWKTYANMKAVGGLIFFSVGGSRWKTAVSAAKKNILAPRVVFLSQSQAAVSVLGEKVKHRVVPQALQSGLFFIQSVLAFSTHSERAFGVCGRFWEGTKLQHYMAFILRTQSISVFWWEVARQATKVILSYPTPAGGAVSTECHSHSQGRC